MKSEELKDYIKKGVKILFERILSDLDEYGFESYIHADLYFILNKVDEKFWNTFSVRMGSEGGFKGFDLVVDDPDEDSNDSLEIPIEVKYWGSKKGVVKDFKRLEKSKDSFFIYVQEPKNDEVTLDFIRDQSNDYTNTETLYLKLDDNKSYSVREGKVVAF